MSKKPIRIVIFDDQKLFLRGLRTVLESEGLEVVGESSDGSDALWLVNATRPDVVLMDLRMPGVDGVQATRQIVAGAPHVPVVVLTTFDDDDLVFEALSVGAVGYILKGLSGTELVQAIEHTLAGQSVLSPEVGRKVLTEFARMSSITPRTDANAQFGLSMRERDVLKVLMTGASNKEIAVAMDLAEGTVKNHISRILDKLGVSSRTEAALLARSRGLV